MRAGKVKKEVSLFALMESGKSTFKTLMAIGSKSTIGNSKYYLVILLLMIYAVLTREIELMPSMKTVTL